jgi:hypothetical protein
LRIGSRIPALAKATNFQLKTRFPEVQFLGEECVLAMATGTLIDRNRQIRTGRRDSKRLRGCFRNWDKLVLAEHTEVSESFVFVGHVGIFLLTWSFCRVSWKLLFPTFGAYSKPTPTGSGAICRAHQERANIEAFDKADDAYPLRWSRDLLSAKGGVRLVDIVEANHYLFLSNEDDVLREIGAFVKRLH